MDNPLLSIIVSWRDRAELSGTLPELIAAARAVGGDVTIVNFGGSPEFRVLKSPDTAYATVFDTFPWPQFEDGVGRVTPCAPSVDSKADVSPRSSGARGATRPTSHEMGSKPWSGCDEHDLLRL